MIFKRNGWELDIEWVFEWPDWVMCLRRKWSRLTLASLSLEAGSVTGKSIELAAILMGVGVRLSISEVQSREEFNRRMKEALRGVATRITHEPPTVVAPGLVEGETAV
jgi:hypothetical protein